MQYIKFENANGIECIIPWDEVILLQAKTTETDNPVILTKSGSAIVTKTSWNSLKQQVKKWIQTKNKQYLNN